jgi:hypothetical protein
MSGSGTQPTKPHMEFCLEQWEPGKDLLCIGHVGFLDGGCERWNMLSTMEF